MTELTRTAVLSALTTLAESTVDIAALGGPVTIRELSARQRQQAQDAATAADPESPDNALYRAMVVQMGVIDHATQAPLLTPEDVAVLANGRDRVMQRLAVAILELSEALPGHLKSGSDPADKGQRDTAPRAEDPSV